MQRKGIVLLVLVSLLMSTQVMAGVDSGTGGAPENSVIDDVMNLLMGLWPF
ncbi:MAG: hypothetical protein MI750_05490 [Xanthomonadales bacterium]|nr:hypothetical protein [Xanthomonadales bacterium]